MSFLTRAWTAGPGRDLFERWHFYQNLVDVLLGSLLDSDKAMYHVFGVVPADDRYAAVFDDFVDHIADNKARRLLGHESLSTTLRYSGLVGADLQRAHRRASAIERLNLDETFYRTPKGGILKVD